MIALLLPNADTYPSTHAGHLQRLDANTIGPRVVFLGSSTFVGLDIAAITGNGLNLSIGGDRAENLLARAKAYRSTRRAVAVVLNIGLNDVLQDCRALESPMAARLSGLDTGGAPLLVVGLQALAPYQSNRQCKGRASQLIAESNAALLAACGARAGCLFVAHPVAEGAADNWLIAAHESDGIHLSRQGYAALTSSLKQALSRYGIQ